LFETTIFRDGREYTLSTNNKLLVWMARRSEVAAKILHIYVYIY
jgi:hypothetical protein